MKRPSSNALRRSAAHWDRQAQAGWKLSTGIYWTDLPAVRRRLNQKASGDPDVDWLQYVVTRYLAGSTPLNRVVSLGCGEGTLERKLADMGVFRRCDGYDIAKLNLQRAVDAATARQISGLFYHQADLNELHLPPASAQAVFAESALHHVANLEGLLTQVRDGLTPGGWLFVNEYVGPSRFQFPNRQLELMNAALRLLPERCRVCIRPTANADRQNAESMGTTFARIVAALRGGQMLGAIRRRLERAVGRARGAQPLKSNVRRPDPRQLAISDPSEAVRSAEIMQLLPRYLTVVEVKPLGGGLLHFLLDDIAGNLLRDVPGNASLLDALFHVEDALMEAGELASDFAMVVARKA